MNQTATAESQSSIHGKLAEAGSAAHPPSRSCCPGRRHAAQQQNPQNARKAHARGGGGRQSGRARGRGLLAECASTALLAGLLLQCVRENIGRTGATVLALAKLPLHITQAERSAPSRRQACSSPATAQACLLASGW